MSSVHFGAGNNESSNDPASNNRDLGSQISKPTKRQRWATTRTNAPGGLKKRVSIMDRLHRRSDLKDEKRKSPATEAPTNNPGEGEEKGPSRRVYFNVPIPEAERDEDGFPNNNYPRNKIRTAKYTPLSFVPKNLWFQFHNIANIYFLLVVILNVWLLLYSLGNCSSLFFSSADDFVAF